MLDEMEMKFNHIQDDFVQYVNGKKDPFDEGRDVDIFDIINSVHTHYVNNEDDFNKMDPKDAAIIALTTKLNTLES
eukprot:4566151-Ditylum_brightwellii.AAC.1